MSKKNIIQILIIIAGFAGSGFVLYKGMFSNKVQVPDDFDAAMVLNSQNPGETVQTEKILPYGSSLNFSKVLNKQKLDFGVLEYPKLDPSSEIGISENLLIKPRQEAGQ